MKLEDKHKEFSVKNYGKSMNASTFFNAIRRQLHDDIPETM